ncbi:hypothetical protein [Archangium lansingense]|uniref:Uncharacterized protein n=1 Tax=Archangium lansingense TaxID=2995310 RepID=A0ABT3ZWN9_9BACT|nr:hypothetical protein [Archangium lansinium]MCY1073793.1 hypothetical protein [Archangium lansinium]
MTPTLLALLSRMEPPLAASSAGFSMGARSSVSTWVPLFKPGSDNAPVAPWVDNAR